MTSYRNITPNPKPSVKIHAKSGIKLLNLVYMLVQKRKKGFHGLNI